MDDKTHPQGPKNKGEEEEETIVRSKIRNHFEYSSGSNSANNSPRSDEDNSSSEARRKEEARRQQRAVAFEFAEDNPEYVKQIHRKHGHARAFRERNAQHSFRLGVFLTITGLITAGIATTLILMSVNIIAVPYATSIIDYYNVASSAQMALGCAVGVASAVSFFAALRCFARERSTDRSTKSQSGSLFPSGVNGTMVTFYGDDPSRRGSYPEYNPL